MRNSPRFTPAGLALVGLFGALLLSGCGLDREGVGPQKLVGSFDQVNLVLSPEEWNNGAGPAIDSALQRTMDGIARPEPMFKVSYAKPEDLKQMRTRERMYLFAVCMDDPSASAASIRGMAKPKTLDRVSREGTTFLIRIDSLYLKGQYALVILSPNSDSLRNFIAAHAEEVRTYFHGPAVEAYRADLRRQGRSDSIQRVLESQHGLEMMVPKDYQVARNEADFLWLREPTSTKDYNVMIAWKEYRDASQLSVDSLIAWRDALGKQYVYGSDDTTSYLYTETYVKVHTQTTSFAGRPAQELRGHWQLGDMTMAGPFVGYAFVDVKRNRLYWAEGFFYGPQVKKTRSLRQLEAVLRTLTLSSSPTF